PRRLRAHPQSTPDTPPKRRERAIELRDAYGHALDYAPGALSRVRNNGTRGHPLRQMGLIASDPQAYTPPATRGIRASNTVRSEAPAATRVAARSPAGCASRHQPLHHRALGARVPAGGAHGLELAHRVRAGAPD